MVKIIWVRVGVRVRLGLGFGLRLGSVMISLESTQRRQKFIRLEARCVIFGDFMKKKSDTKKLHI